MYDDPTFDMVAIIKDLKNNIGIKEVFDHYCPGKIKSKSRALCPFHDDTHTSFGFHKDGKQWKCFTCKIGGDIFDFVQRKEKCSFNEAITILCTLHPELKPHCYGKNKKKYDRSIETIDDNLRLLDDDMDKKVNKLLEIKLYLAEHGVKMNSFAKKLPDKIPPCTLSKMFKFNKYYNKGIPPNSFNKYFNAINNTYHLMTEYNEVSDNHAIEWIPDAKSNLLSELSKAKEKV